MSNVRSARLVMLAAKRSTIGHLTALSSGEEVPFGIRRLFFITDMPVGAIRGNHAHKTCEQFLFAIIGSVCIEVKDAAGGRLSFDLRAAEAGLYVPSRLWLVVRATSDRACLGVLASHAYDSEDYIRAWEDFIRQGSLS